VAAVCISAGLIFAVFIVLMVHSTYRSLKGSRCIAHLLAIHRQHYSLVAQPLTDEHEVDSEAQTPEHHVTAQVLFFNELREPVMEYCEESN